jgi:hypothetical protein
MGVRSERRKVKGDCHVQNGRALHSACQLERGVDADSRVQLLRSDRRDAAWLPEITAFSRAPDTYHFSTFTS